MAKRITYIVLMILFSLGIRAQKYKIGDLVVNKYGEQGIVFWLHPDGIEGWAVGLQDIVAESGWGLIMDIPTLTNNTQRTNFQDIDTSGYSNTKIIRDFLGPGNTYPAQMVDFDKGWYIPAREQLLILSAAFPFIEQAITNHGGVPMTDSIYFSSTEYSYESVHVSYWHTAIANLYLPLQKNISGSVRPVFTFKIHPLASDTTLTYIWNTGNTTPVITQQPTETTTYTVEVLSKAGCSATASTQIFVADGTNDTLHAQICKGEVYRENGFDESKPGTYTRTLPGPGGCDVSVTLELTVGEPDTTRLPAAAICEGERYMEHNFDLSEPGEHIQRWQRPGGCDSVVILQLNVAPIFQKVLYDTVCYGDAYRENGLNLSRVTAPGTHYLTRSAFAGCDTSVTLHLAVNPVRRTTVFDTLRFGTAYSGNGFYITNALQGGVHTNVALGSCRCDSVATLYLAVRTFTNDTTLYDTICAGEPYNRYGFLLSAVQADTTLKDTLANRSGRDSIIYLKLTVNDSIVKNTSETICAGELPYTWSDTTFLAGTRTGVYRFQRTRAATGCDSIVYLTLTVNDSIVKNTSATICAGELPYTWSDTTFLAGTRTGVYRFQRMSKVTGCDSIVYLTLTVNDSIVKDTSETICAGELPYTWSDTTFLAGTKSEEFRFQRTSKVTGCDSIVYLTLTVSDSIVKNTSETICAGELPYTWSDTTFLAGTKTGVYRFQLTSKVTGCDSLVSLHLHVYPTWHFNHSESICAGDTLDFRGRMLTGSGIYYDSLATARGCDSIYRMQLTVNPVYDIRLSGVLCEDSSYTEHGFDVAEAGVYIRNLHTMCGCDSTVTLTLTEEKKIAGGIGLRLEDCVTHAYAFFPDITDPESLPVLSYYWEMGDGTIYQTQDRIHHYRDSGEYLISLRMETKNRCVTAFSHLLHVPHYLHEIPIRTDREVIEEGASTVNFEVDVPPGTTCVWEFGDGTTAKGSHVSHTYTLGSEPYYDVLLSTANADSCITESITRIEVSFSPEIPNTFSPNGDGINDVFAPGYRVEIINRNGLRIHEGDNGWDGNYKGKQANQETYFYRLYHKTKNGEKTKTGYVILIR